MSRPLTPAEIIGKAHQRLADAKSGPALDASLDSAHGAIHTLLDLRLITVFAWREAIAGVDQQAEQLAKELEAIGGAQ
jgi:hypothetical protein